MPPTFAAQLTEAELHALIEYVKSLTARPEPTCVVRGALL